MFKDVYPERGWFVSSCRQKNRHQGGRKERDSVSGSQAETNTRRRIVKLATGWPVAAFCPVSFRQKVVFLEFEPCKVVHRKDFIVYGVLGSHLSLCK